MENYPGFETKPKRKKENGISIDIVIQSHLSDALVEISNDQSDIAYNRVLFAKRLIQLRGLGKINERISEEKLNEIWKETVNQ
jgi:hypothetical protein